VICTGRGVIAADVVDSRTTVTKEERETGVVPARSGATPGVTARTIGRMARPATSIGNEPADRTITDDRRPLHVSVPSEAPCLNPAAARVLARIIQRAVSAARHDGDAED